VTHIIDSIQKRNKKDRSLVVDSLDSNKYNNNVYTARSSIKYNNNVYTARSSNKYNNNVYTARSSNKYNNNVYTARSSNKYNNNVYTARSSALVLVFCRLIFVLLYWSLYCLFFFALRLLITTLVSSNFS
jgi:ATP-dependent Zn protease